jgi:hypothetical protein
VEPVPVGGGVAVGGVVTMLGLPVVMSFFFFFFFFFFF